VPHDSKAGAPPIVEISHLSFGYTPGLRVLEIDRLTVEPGSVTAVIGPNGCGKTTLFKAINGLIGPYAGTLRFQGQEISTPEGRERMRRGSIYVHQKPYAFRERVSDNVLYGLKVRKIAPDRRQDRMEAALQAVGMTHLAHRHAQALSGGERQRLALARALALEPSLILMDEPTSNIDPESVRLIEGAIQDAQKKGTTVLLSTHNLATAYRIADIVVPMEAGSLKRNPNNVYKGKIDKTEESLAHFRVEGGHIVVPAQEGAFR
jgi:tungstate transport system ATP-binding protein